MIASSRELFLYGVMLLIVGIAGGILRCDANGRKSAWAIGTLGLMMLSLSGIAGSSPSGMNRFLPFAVAILIAIHTPRSPHISDSIDETASVRDDAAGRDSDQGE